MSQYRFTRLVVATFVLAALSTPASAADDQATRAVHLRSQGLNERYGLGDTTDPAQRALHLRSAALNDRYGAGRTVRTPDVRIVRVPSAEATSRGWVDWTDAGIGAGAMLLGIGLISLGAYTVMQRRRTHPARRQTATTA